MKTVMLTLLTSEATGRALLKAQATELYVAIGNSQRRQSQCE